MEKSDGVFIHVPRTAGTSIRFLVGGEGGHKKATELDLKDTFSFAFVRNPYDRLLSAFHHRHRGATQQGFSRFVETLETSEAENHHLYNSMCYWLCGPEGVILPSFVGRYENITEDWKLVSERIGIYEGLPWLNMLNTPDWYMPETKEKVYKIYKKDFKIFGYEQ